MSAGHKTSPSRSATLPALATPNTTTATSKATPVMSSGLTASPTSSSSSAGSPPDTRAETNNAKYSATSAPDEDPLVTLEHSLMARPLRSFTMPATNTEHTHHLFARREREPAEDPSKDHSFHFHPHHRAHISSRSPTPGARRCMASTAAWEPRLDRRQSWDGQAYRRALMVETAGMLRGACPRHHHNNTSGVDGGYEVDRGFTETEHHHHGE